MSTLLPSRIDSDRSKHGVAPLHQPRTFGGGWIVGTTNGAAVVPDTYRLQAGDAHDTTSFDNHPTFHEASLERPPASGNALFGEGGRIPPFREARKRTADLSATVRPRKTRVWCRTSGARPLAMDPALPGWADVWCRPSGPGLQTPLSHVHSSHNLPRCHGTPGQVATLGGCDFFNFPCSLWPESSEEHLPTSIAGVLRLRAINPLLCDRSARRFAPTARRGRQDDAFLEGTKQHLVGCKKHEKIEKVTGSRG